MKFNIMSAVFGQKSDSTLARSLFERRIMNFSSLTKLIKPFKLTCSTLSNAYQIWSKLGPCTMEKVNSLLDNDSSPWYKASTQMQKRVAQSF